MTALPSETIDVVKRVLAVLAAGHCPSALVGGCAVALRSGVATRPVRDVDIYCRDRKTPLSLLTATGLLQVGHSKLRCGETIVDIVHPDLPRINKVNRLFLEYCLVSQRPLLIPCSDGTISSLSCPTTLALLALKLYSVTHRTMWLTRRHDLHDALSLIVHPRVKPDAGEQLSHSNSGDSTVADPARDAMQQFLLQEHQAIEADTQRLRQEGATRLNILVALIAGLAAATVVVITSVNITTATKTAVGYGVLASVLVYTLLCYSYFIDREITTDSNFRALSRIRRYYVDLYPPASNYISWSTHDGATHQLTNNRSFVLHAVRHLIAIQVAAGVGIGLATGGVGSLASIFAAVASYGLATLALRRWSSRRFSKAAMSAAQHSRFPGLTAPTKGTMQE